MNLSDDSEDEKRGFLRRYWPLLGVGLVVLVLAPMIISQLGKSDRPAPPRVREVFIIRPLPPPPPPPPPMREPPKEVVEKMIDQTPMDKLEEKPDDRPKDLPPAALMTNLTGPGSDGFGLGSGNGGGSGGGGGGGHGSRFGWYAGQVQKTIQAALNRNPVVGQAQFVEKARIWADPTGRVTRVRLSGSTGDPTIDRAIEEALTGLQLQEPPPRDMPMPIIMRLAARRPG